MILKRKNRTGIDLGGIGDQNHNSGVRHLNHHSMRILLNWQYCGSWYYHVGKDIWGIGLALQAFSRVGGDNKVTPCTHITLTCRRGVRILRLAWECPGLGGEGRVYTMILFFGWDLHATIMSRIFWMSSWRLWILSKTNKSFRKIKANLNGWHPKGDKLDNYWVLYHACKRWRIHAKDYATWPQYGLDFRERSRDTSTCMGAMKEAIEEIVTIKRNKAEEYYEMDRYDIKNVVQNQGRRDNKDWY
ncbi:hypothetical protein L1987_25534 [Smallanthus sonchifolius]|uniref:Uncharacterized protein n=1 Tax=Smallanthus sonchifolius TaxID=185202 RepID=A0ACB9IN99_9ASTR|nr:hypothetical protein L1987_25534 [Smallanthus sonchifolius]